MGLKKIQVDVEENVYQVAEGLGIFGAKVFEVLKDGWQPGQDIAPLMAELMILIPKLAVYDKLAEAVKQYPVESGNAVLEGLLPAFKSAV